MKPLTEWNHTFVDIERGIAVFDELAIEADSISDPRWDRVLPVTDEEQIFMCRMMESLFGSMPAESRVLDVGTGSGVFAIQSARLGRPTVAIDIVPRASRYARYNARKHGISLVEGDPGPNQLNVLTQDFLKFKEEKRTEKFDVILVNPPFSPTCDGFEPAVHAKAGHWGQDCFDQWLPKASELLKAGGCCAGIHMMLVNPDGSLACQPLMEECFKHAAFSYTFVMEPFPVRDLLEGTYHSFLSDLDVCDYIDCAPDRDFALVYFEIRTPKSSATTNGSWTRLDAGAVPREISWQKDRIPLHRKIIENSSHEHSIPAPALFMRNHFGTEDISNHQATQEDSTVERRRAPMKLIDRWIRHQGAIGDAPDSMGFCWLLVDAAPWYPTAQGRQQLVSETALWGLREKLARHGAHILGTYAQNTRSLHRTGIAPFLHPHFTGAHESITWRGVHFSVNHPLPNEETSESDNSAFDSLVDAMAEEVREKYDPLLKSPSVSDNGSFVSIARNLVELDVGHIVEYERKREPWVRKIKEHSDDSGINPDAIGLELRHQAMHRRLDQILLPDLPSAGATSYFLGFPVTFRSVASEENDQSGGLPASYRGGVWVYAIAHGDWTPERERFMFDLAMLLSMMFETEYSDQAANELRRIGNYESAAAIFHQIPKDFSALEERLAKLRDAVNGPDINISKLHNLIPNTDATAFLIMAADAAVGRDSYRQLPSDIPERLENGCTPEVVDEIYGRLVVPYVQQRITRDEVPGLRDYETDRVELEASEFKRKYPFPSIEKFSAFRPPDSSKCYIWLLLVLRSATFHAYRSVIADRRESGEAKIGISYDPSKHIISISNTGGPPADAAPKPQEGWRRDIAVFAREQDVWQILEEKGYQFSIWDSSTKKWVTHIQHKENK